MKQTNQKDAVLIQLGLFALALEILIPKRRDYSGDVDPYANLRKSADAWGTEDWRGTGIRMQDKLSRTQAIMDAGGKSLVANEKLTTDWADVLNYLSIIAGLCIEKMPDGDAVLHQLRAAAKRLPGAIEDVLKAVE